MAFAACASPRPIRAISSRDIIDAIDDNPVLCNHVHLPVQSGSSSVLERMQRLYTRDEYMRRIDWMRQARRNISITTDIIVGFPGETEADFDQTLALLDEVQYDSLFSFKYSRRPNTSALELPGHVPEDEKSRRLAILQEKQRAIQIQPQFRGGGDHRRSLRGRL